MSAAGRIVDSLRDRGCGPSQSGKGWSARCPGHDDRSPSLSLRQIEGQALVYCFAGCATADVLAALDLSMRDLYDEPTGASYRYDDGRVVHRSPDKTFRQSGQTKGRGQLYRHAQVLAAVDSGQTIWCCEGEKDAHALEELGAIATTAPMGAGNWHKVDPSPLYGGQVVVVVDNDEAGQKWAAAVRACLHGKAKSLSFVRAKTGKDAADHLAARHTLDEFVPITEMKKEEGTTAKAELWPALSEAALHGPVGDFVRQAAPHTEADKAGILLACLVMLGAAIGRGPYVLAGNEMHGTGLFTVLVGSTAKGRKGTAVAVARALMNRVDPEFTRRIIGGFGSGEALVDALRDPDEDHPGADDKMLCLVEPEYARMLKVAGREGSTLAQVIRAAWDGIPMEARSRARTVVASNYLVGAVCQVASEELRARLTDTETYGGTANRFLFGSVRRGRLLPNGGNVPDEVLDRAAQLLAQRVTAAKQVGQVHRTTAADRDWDRMYRAHATDDPNGLLGAVIGRDDAQCLRLALLYCLLDNATVIDVEHLAAAQAVWDYCRASAERLFGDRIGDPVADRLLDAIHRAGPDGLDRTGQDAALGKHVTAARRGVAVDRLVDLGLVRRQVQNDTGGRARELLLACGESGESGESGASPAETETEPTSSASSASSAMRDAATATCPQCGEAAWLDEQGIFCPPCSAEAGAPDAA